LGIIYKGIRKGDIRVNKKKVTPDTHTREGDVLFISRYFISGISRKYEKKKEPVKQAEEKDSDLVIVFENEHVLALNKPAGLLVHGEISLEKKVKAYVNPVIPPSLSFEPGPVHRLDRNTSGLILFSKSLAGARTLSKIFKKNLCEKYYLGLFDGRIEKETEWRDRVYRDKNRKKTCLSQDPGAQEAITSIKPLFLLKRKTIALCAIHTGITHQIRAQGMIHGHPLTGDKKYGSRLAPVSRGHYILHSWCIHFPAFHKIIGRTTLFARFPRRLHKKLASLCGTGQFNAALARIQEKIRRGSKTI
jgi:23S rRNA pseudouridine955/2504/2580 synthase